MKNHVFWQGLEYSRLLKYLFILSHIYFSVCRVYFLPSSLTCHLYHRDNKNLQVSYFHFSLKIHSQILILMLIHFRRPLPVTGINIILCELVSLPLVCSPNSSPSKIQIFTVTRMVFQNINLILLFSFLKMNSPPLTYGYSPISA